MLCKTGLLKLLIISFFIFQNFDSALRCLHQSESLEWLVISRDTAEKMLLKPNKTRFMIPSVKQDTVKFLFLYLY